MTQPPEVLTYGTVKWWVAAFLADSPLDPDTNPDLMSVNGTAFLTYDIVQDGLFVNEGTDTPLTLLKTPMPLRIVNGHLEDLAGNRTVKVLASDSPGLSQQGWTYEMRFELDDGLTFGSFHFLVNTDEEVDITNKQDLSIDPVPGVVITKGASGDAATVTVGTVTTVAPDQPADVDNSGTFSDAVLNFYIPRGVDGIDGVDGTDGEAYGGGFVVAPIDPLEPLELTVTSRWGIDPVTGPYYNEDGVAGTEAALLMPDPFSGEFLLFKPGEPVAGGAGVPPHTHTSAQISDAVSAATPSRLIKRDAAGRAQVVDGTAAADIVTKGQLDGKAATSHTHLAANITDTTTVGRAVMTAVDAAAARTATGAGTSSLVLGTTAGTAKAGDYAPPAATTGATGLIQLANHLGGTATAPTVRQANETQTGIVELATTAEVTTGTDTLRAVTPAGVKTVTDAVSAAAVARANHTGTQTASTISDFTESVQDIIGTAVVAGTGIAVSYDDTAGTHSISATGGGGGATDPEIVRDTVATFIVGGTNITTSHNDAGDTLTVNTSATVNATDAALRDRSTHTGTQSADTLTDGSTNRLFLSAEKTKLAAVDVNATANSSDAQLRDRSTHTGAQAISTVTGLQTALDAKIASFADPNADRIVFWDDSAGAYAALTPGTGLAITTTTMAVATASETVQGIVELATNAETVTGTDTTRATHAAGTKAAIDAVKAAEEGLAAWTGSAWPTRPTGYARIRWIGGTAASAPPAVTGDVWEKDA